jgi:hypothetical protein
MRTLISIAGAALLLAGCGGKGDVKDLKNAFEKPADGGVSAQANKDVKEMMDRAVTAIQSGDNLSAVANLDELRHRPDLGPDQAMRVQQMMGRVQTEIAERAQAGDAQAQAQMQMIRAGKMRTPR